VAWVSVRECHPTPHGLQLEANEASGMNPWKRIVTRRQRKAHERYLAERAREQALEGHDAQDAVRKVAEGSAGMQGYTKVQ
jgi:hypothetical protein